MSWKRILIVACIFCKVFEARAQQASLFVHNDYYKRSLDFDNQFLNMGDSVFIKFNRESCKSASAVLLQSVPVVAVPRKAGVSFLTVHGNINYNFLYKSLVDTPFEQNNLQRHTFQTVLNFLFKDKYPVQMYITNRSSNSPYFRNVTDVNVNFKGRELLERIKSQLLENALDSIKSVDFSKMEQKALTRKEEAKNLQRWINSPARAQELIEAKEYGLKAPVQYPGFQNSFSDTFDRLAWKGSRGFDRRLQNNLTQVFSQDSVVRGNLKDTLKASEYQRNKEKLTSLLLQIKQDDSLLNHRRKVMSDSVDKIKRELSALHTPSDLLSYMKKEGISRSQLTKIQRMLLMVDQAGIGRNWVNYSELTVKNVSVTGVNFEMNPSPFYFAFAAGKVNYLFRDFLFKKTDNYPSQSLEIIRAGIGQKEKNNCIVSFYNGRKSNFNYLSGGNEDLQRILGISVEGKISLNANNYIIAEVAKSSYNSAGERLSSSGMIKKAFDLKTHTNEAYSLKLYGDYPQTQTLIKAFFKRTGQNFQSFNVSPVNLNADSWKGEVKQSLWKNRVTLTGGVSKNDFLSPVTLHPFSSKTLFKYIETSLRIPKYPFIFFGFYPTSQLSLSDNNLLIENLYNTMNVLLNYSYTFKSAGMNTNAVFTKFYNNSSDSGFIYFNAATWTVNQSAFLGKFSLQSTASLSLETGFHLFTLSQHAGYQFKNTFTIGGELKWSRFNRLQNLIGGSATLNINIQKFGSVQLNYGKTFLPTQNRTLKPVDQGQINFFRVF
ncbi:MAG: hypothetical protein ACTHML_05835 [Ginsengibacter sp.]